MVLASTEDVWTDIFRQAGGNYRKPTLVLFTDQVSSACGQAGAAVGPFYCPGDEKLYLDFAFFRDLQTRFRAPGDFAQAYVIAHEVGHHVQNCWAPWIESTLLNGKEAKLKANELSIRLELQADSLAGVWAHYAQRKGLLDQGDVEEALGRGQRCW